MRRVKSSAFTSAFSNQHSALLSDSSTRRYLLIEAYERGLAAFGACREDHAVRLDAHQLRWLQVEHHRDRPADQLFGLVRFCDAGDERALLGPDVDRHLHELPRVRDLLRG